MTLTIKTLDGYFEGHIQAESSSINLAEAINKENPEDSELYRQVINLPKWKIEAIRKTCTMAIQNSFERPREPKYGNLPRGMSDEQLHSFFSTIRNKDAKLEFCLMFFLGLRVGEVSKIEILKDHGLVRINSEKTNKCHFLPLVEPLKSIFGTCRMYIRHTPNYLRKVFRKVCSEAGIAFSYGISKKGKPLYSITTHSFRHSAINRFAEVVHGDPFKVSAFSRHSVRSIGVQAVYRHYEMDSLRIDMERCFEKYGWIIKKEKKEGITAFL